jgi:hypothetical protein
VKGEKEIRGNLQLPVAFGRAIGAFNCPELDRRFVGGKCHTAPVGSRGGEPRVVMDVLNFWHMTAKGGGQ